MKLKQANRWKLLVNVCLSLCLLISFFVSSIPVLAEENELTTDIQELENVQEPQNEPLELEEQPSDEIPVIDDEMTLEQQDVIANQLYEELTLNKYDVNTMEMTYFPRENTGYLSVHNSDGKFYVQARIVTPYMEKVYERIIKDDPSLVGRPYLLTYEIGIAFEGVIQINYNVFIIMQNEMKLNIDGKFTGYMKLSSIEKYNIFDISYQMSFDVKTQAPVSTDLKLRRNDSNYDVITINYHHNEPTFGIFYGNEGYAPLRGKFTLDGLAYDTSLPLEPEALPTCTGEQIPLDSCGITPCFYFYENEIPSNKPMESMHLTCTYDGKKVYKYVEGSSGGGIPDDGNDFGWFQPLVDFFTGLFAPILSMLSTLVSNILTGLGSITIPLPSDWVPQAIKEKMPSSQSRMGLTLLIPIGLLIGFILMGVANVFAFDFSSIPKFFQSVASYFFVKINDPLAPDGVLATSTQFSLDIRNTFKNLFGELTSLPTMIKDFIDGASTMIGKAINSAVGFELSNLSPMTKILEDGKSFLESIPKNIYDVKEAVLGIPLSIGSSMADALGDILDLTPLKSIKDAVLGIPLFFSDMMTFVNGIPLHFADIRADLGALGTSIATALSKALNIDFTPVNTKFDELMKWLVGMPQALIDMLMTALQTLITTLFVPNSQMFISQWSNIKLSFSLKLPFIAQMSALWTSIIAALMNIGTAKPLIEVSLPEILGGMKILAIDFQWFDEYRNTIHLIILFIVYYKYIMKLPLKVGAAIKGMGRAK